MKSLLITIFIFFTGIFLFAFPSFSNVTKSFEPPLTIEIIPPTIPDLYSECRFPEVSIRISNCGTLKSKITIEANISPEAEIISDGWTKSVPGRWLKLFQVDGTGELRFKIALNLIDKSKLDELRLGISISDHEKQVSASNEEQLCSRSVVNLSSEKSKIRTSQLIASHKLNANSSECGLKTYFLEGEMIIDEDLEINNSATQFIIAPGSVIIVKKGATFSVKNASFSSCGNWQGIKGEDGSNIVLKNTSIEGVIQPTNDLDRSPDLFEKDPTLLISPNPGVSTVIIQDNRIKVDNKYSVSAEDIQGKSYSLPLLSKADVNKSEMSIDVSLLPNGFYILKITSFTDNSFLSGKLVVAH